MLISCFLFLVRQLCCAENDRRSRAFAAQIANAQNPTARLHAAQIYIRKTHSGQTGKVLLEEQCRLGTHWTALQRSYLKKKLSVNSHTFDKKTKLSSP